MRHLFLFFTVMFVSHGISQTNRALNFLDDFASQDTAYVSIFADGNLQGLVADADGAEGLASGALGISVARGEKVLWLASINVASTSDTITNNFGSAILTPAGGKSLTSGTLELYYKNLFKIRGKEISLHTYASASSAKWKSATDVKSATVSGLGVTIVNDIIDSQSRENSVYLGFEFGLSYRTVLGDAINEEDFLQNTIGIKGNSFLGFEGGLKIKFNRITAGLQGYYLWDIENGEKTDGITSFQIVGGISITGAIFQDKFKLDN